MPVGNWGVLRAMLRYPRREARFAEANDRQRVRLRELAEDRRRWGYRRLHVLLKREGLDGKQQTGRPDLRRREADGAQTRAEMADLRQVVEFYRPRPRGSTRHGRWILLQDAFASGLKVRTLSLEDAYTREMLSIEVGTSFVGSSSSSTATPISGYSTVTDFARFRG